MPHRIIPRYHFLETTTTSIVLQQEWKKSLRLKAAHKVQADEKKKKKKKTKVMMRTQLPLEVKTVINSNNNNSNKHNTLRIEMTQYIIMESLETPLRKHNSP